ncbi:hypothetical protein QR680_000423 [Steinernema hermaphroditum]|uniref:Carboxylic ester hydrolase n=1 Tax=Steinernema hermaphroditum TaxID=289476 RepID=A0AA39GWJ5_9BILA|nr:hypothetical protein QR680_000423 [Steinernema hermaphroditum]
MPVVVRTKQGQIQGYESIFLHNRVRSFLSVPFAEPPIGGRDNYNVTFWGSEMWNHNTPVREDCLYMNIWAPADAHNLTVMVWLFGGGYYSGSPSLVLYDGKALAVRANVVVVNINYRVGPFGYLYFDDDEAPGNVGMLDQQLALHWVRENAVHFGGNPARISLFGESAGAASIVAHLIAPGSRGIFKHGILQSGSLDNKWSLDTPQRALDKSREFADLLQCNRTTTKETIACLREKEPQALIAQIWNLNLSFLEFPFVIVSKDKNFFREFDAFDALRNGLFRKDVDLMIGINHDEGNFWNIYNLPKYFDVSEQPVLSMDNFNDCVDKAFATQPEVVRNSAKFIYLKEEPCKIKDEKSKFLAEQVNQMVGDYFFTCDSLWLADQMSEGPGRVYIYYFDQPSSANPWPSWTGVMHGYEIEYVFGVPIYNTTAGYTHRESSFSEKIIQYWSSFAADGVPRLAHSKKSDSWPAYHPIKDRRWMYLRGGSHIRPMLATKAQECSMWRSARDIEYMKYVNSNTAVSSTVSTFAMFTSTVILSLATLLLLH